MRHLVLRATSAVYNLITIWAVWYAFFACLNRSGASCFVDLPVLLSRTPVRRGPSLQIALRDLQRRFAADCDLCF